MKTYGIRKIISLTVPTLLVLTSVSCGDVSQSVDVTTASSAADTSADAVTGFEYKYPTADLKGDTFTILNTAQTYNFFSSLDFEEQTGDTLNDAIYERNRAVEERYNFKLEINEEYTLDKAAAALQTAVLAGDDIYDAAFIRDYYLSTSITEGYLADLDSITSLQLDQPWWDGEVTESTRVGKSRKAFLASCDVSLVDFEGTMVSFFNCDMLEKLGLDTPYKLVLDGKWTFEKLVEYMKAGANLNGDDSFTYKADGNAIYGMTGFEHSINALLESAGVSYITKDNDGNLAFGLDNEKFYNTAIKISETFEADGDYHFANSNATGSCELIFKQGRALFLLAQLKASNTYRDMESAYGIVPIPKWDESQENYCNLRTYSYLMVIPTTNTRQNETGIIMDAMAYLSHSDILPLFYDGRLSQKNLRDEESVKMLDIIAGTRHIDIGTTYGMFQDISKNINKLVNEKSTDFASMVATVKPTVEANLLKLMNTME